MDSFHCQYSVFESGVKSDSGWPLGHPSCPELSVEKSARISRISVNLWIPPEKDARQLLGYRASISFACIVNWVERCTELKLDVSCSGQNAT